MEKIVAFSRKGLKPCPHCGGRAHLFKVWTPGTSPHDTGPENMYRVSCDLMQQSEPFAAGCGSETLLYEKAHEACAAWNRRFLDPAAVDRILNRIVDRWKEDFPLPVAAKIIIRDIIGQEFFTAHAPPAAAPVSKPKSIRAALEENIRRQDEIIALLKSTNKRKEGDI